MQLQKKETGANGLILLEPLFGKIRLFIIRVEMLEIKSIMYGERRSLIERRGYGYESRRSWRPSSI